MVFPGSRRLLSMAIHAQVAQFTDALNKLGHMQEVTPPDTTSQVALTEFCSVQIDDYERMGTEGGPRDREKGVDTEGAKTSCVRWSATTSETGSSGSPLEINPEAGLAWHAQAQLLEWDSLSL